MFARISFALKRLPLFTLTAGVGLTIGFLVPVAYELMDEPWNRSRLVGLERAALVTAVLTCLLGALAAWLGRNSEPSETAGPRKKFQFRIWQLFAAMSVAAILLAAQRWLDLSWASALVAGVALGVLGWSLLLEARARSRMAALVAALFCPAVWIVAYNEPFGGTSGLVAAIPFVPAVLPAELIRVFTSAGGPDEMAQIAGLIVIAELLLGAWLARRGGKLFACYLGLILLVSSVSSFGMHALYRA
jgi:hypothetical protein